MKASQVLRYLDDQRRAIEALVDQLDEVQVEFNAQFDEFKSQHDETLDRLADQVIERMDAISPELRSEIEGRLPDERKRLEERRQKVQEEYLPKRQQAADDLLSQAQAELSRLRALNPELDEREEELKREKAELEARLVALNEEIRKNSRGLGVALHFIAITKADRERHRILGKLEGINDSLHNVRLRWDRERTKVEAHQAEYQDSWQLESIAVARLQSELDQLNDETRREELALGRAARYVLDALKEPTSSSDPEVNAGLGDMVRLNIQTDTYHEGLASVGGMIGLLQGINSGMQAIRKSIEGLQNEQQMHSSYLKPLNFSMPKGVEEFHSQWPSLAKQFADEKTIGANPAEFSANVEPLLEGPLSQSNIEAMFNALGEMIKQATAGW